MQYKGYTIQIFGSGRLVRDVRGFVKYQCSTDKEAMAFIDSLE